MSSFWGTGTIFYGEDDFDPRDGSYITTEWITAICIPLIPLVSYRIWKSSEETKFHVFPLGFSKTMEYKKVKVKFNWRQVLKTYIWAVLVWIFIAIIIIKKTSS